MTSEASGRAPATALVRDPSPAAASSRYNHAVEPDEDRRQRAALRRERATLRKTRLSEREHDLSPERGPDALSLVTRLSVESWAEAGLEVPTYTRRNIPCRFVPARAT